MGKLKKDKSIVIVEVDGKQAINELGKLEMESRELRIDMKNAKKGTEEYIKANKRLNEVTQRIGEVRKELGLTGMTMGQLSRYQRDLRKEITNTATKGTERYNELRIKLQEVNATILAQRQQINSTGSALDGAFAKASRFVGAFGIFIGAAGIVQGFKTLIGVSSEFEQSMSNLSAITGATGEQLDELEAAARRIGGATSLSAQQTADAFTIIASKKPELLENNAALIAMTESAITLAEAAGIDLPTAADALTNSLNQFGLGAEEADRFINVLAAGSKFGAGSIEFLNDSVKRFGPIAASMGISIEQSVGMMEVFAEKGLESEKAGTQFRNILIKLASGADDTNPAIVGMGTAIDNLAAKQMSAAGIAKMFGSENIVAAQVMIESSARFEDLTNKVTGTQTAVEQAQIRLQNFRGDLQKLSSVTGDYAIVIGGLITKILGPIVRGFTSLLHILKETPQFIRDNKDLFVALGIALITFNAQQIIATGLMLKDIAVKKVQAIWTGAVTTAQNLLNAAMTANPIGLVIKAVGLLTAGFIILYNRSEKVRAAVAGIGAVAKEVWEIVKETFGQFIDGFQKILDGNFKDGVKDIGKAILKTNPIGLAAMEGKRLAGAFAKGYKDKLDDEKENIQESASDLTTGLINPAAADPTDGSGGGGGGSEDKLKPQLDDYTKQWEEYRRKLIQIQRDFALLELEEDEREKEKVRQKYRELEEELIRHWENKLITNEEFEARLQEIDVFRKTEIQSIEDKHQEALLNKKKDAERKITEATMSERELTLLKVNESYDELIKIAEQFGIDTASIEEARQQRLSEIKDRYASEDLRKEREVADAKIMLATELSGALGAAINFIGNRTGELNAFQKILAGAQIALDTAASLGKIIPLAIDASKGTGPAAPFIFAGYLASMGASVLGAAAKAKAALGSAQTPLWNDSQKSPGAQRGRVSTPPRTSFYYGGATSGGLGFGDQFGEFAGYVHKKEYVVPTIVTQDPWVANLLPAIESIRQDRIRGFATGGPTSGGNVGSNAPGMSTERMEQLMEIMISKMDMMPRQVRAYLVYNDLEEMQEEMETLKSRYTA